jgi:hypothetical protein
MTKGGNVGDGERKIMEEVKILKKSSKNLKIELFGNFYEVCKNSYIF